MKLPGIAGAGPFAHLMGLGLRAKTEKDKEDKNAEDDEEAEDGEDEDNKDAEDGEDEDNKDAEDAEDADEADEDEDDKEKEKAKSFAAGRKAERARCRAIFACKAAGSRPDLAAHLAFETGLAKVAAVSLLEAAAANQPSGRSDLAGRMAGMNIPNVGNGDAGAPSSGTAEGLAAKMVAVYDRVSGTKR